MSNLERMINEINIPALSKEKLFEQAVEKRLNMCLATYENVLDTAFQHLLLYNDAHNTKLARKINRLLK